MELNRIFEDLEHAEEIDERTESEIDEIDDDILISDVYRYYKQRQTEDEEYPAVRDALPLLKEGIDRAIEKDWYNVAAEYHYQSIHLKSHLSGHNADAEIEDALSFLMDNRTRVGSHRAMRIVELINDNLSDISDDRKDEWIEFVETSIEDAHSNGDFDTERSYLRKLRDVKSRYDENTTALENDLIETYRLEADWQEDNSLLVKADVLRAGLNNCGQYMSDEQKEDWKQEALEARRRGTEEEMVEISPDNIPNMDYDGDIFEDLNREMRENSEFISNRYKLFVEKYDQSFRALYYVLASDALIPDVTKMRLNSEQFVLQNMISRKLISPEYNTLSTNPMEESDTIPNNYQMNARSLMDSSANAFYQLIKEGHLSIRDFIVLLRVSDSLSPDTEAFLTESLFDLFDGNQAQSLFLSLPHIEGTIVDTLSSIGKTAYTNIEGGTQQQNLGGLFKDVDAFDEDYTTYLRWRYTNRAGLNLRNRAAHGQLRYANANYFNSLMAICDVIRMMIRINSSAYWRVFGPPENLVPMSTNYGKDMDLSLYTDLNRQVIGYGEADDQHSFVVLRNHRNEDTIEIFVEKGRISRYEIGHMGLEREEIISRIDLLGGKFTEIPSSIEYTWLTNNKILDELTENIENVSSDKSDKVQKEVIFEEARKKGIDESTARMAFDQLEEDSKIEQTEDTVSLRD